MTIPSPSYFKYKETVLVMFLSGLAMTVFGIPYFPEVYFAFSTSILVFYLFKIVSMTSGVVVNYFKYRKVASEIGTFDARAANSLSSHVFVLPSFKEDIQVIKETLSFLCKHPYADTYYVFLAMEKREQGSLEKAATLQK